MPLPHSFPHRITGGLHQLPDGRQLEFEIVGLATGRTVVHFHGTPGSAAGVGFFAENAAKLGLRVIGISRPGFGRSTTHESELPFVDFLGDVLHLLDALGVKEFGISSWSGGGPYALAFADRYPERLTGVALVAPAERIDVALRAAPKGLARKSQHLAALVMRVPILNTFIASALAIFTPAYRKQGFHAMRAVVHGIIDALKQGAHATLRELDLIDDDHWGVNIHDIQYPGIQLFQGMLDTVVDPEATVFLADVLPESSLVKDPAANHTLIMSRYIRSILLAASPDKNYLP